jgi:hypothetical protein
LKTYKYKVELELKTADYNLVKDVRAYVKNILEGEQEFSIKSIGKSESTKPRSRKNKGVKFQNWVAEKISKITGITWGKDELIQPRVMGNSGTDIALMGTAKEKFPWSVEAKCQENFSIQAWIEQAKSNQSEGMNWLLLITKNDYDKLAILDANIFFDIWEQYLTMLYGKDHKIK